MTTASAISGSNSTLILAKAAGSQTLAVNFQTSTLSHRAIAPRARSSAPTISEHFVHTRKKYSNTSYPPASSRALRLSTSLPSRQYGQIRPKPRPAHVPLRQGWARTCKSSPSPKLLPSMLCTPWTRIAFKLVIHLCCVTLEVVPWI